MKVVYMIDKIDTDQAGTENQLLKMIAGVAGSGVEVELICLRDDPWFSSNQHRFPCRTSVARIDGFLRFHTLLNFVRLVRHLRQARPDVVHTFFPVANILGVFAAWLAGVRGIVSSRRDYGEWMLGRYLTMTKWANRLVSVVAANSPSVGRLTIERERVDRSKVEVILNGMEVAPFREVRASETLRSSLGLRPHSKVVGIIANFRPMKRHETLIRAAGELKQRGMELEYLLVGEAWDRRRELEALARTLGVERQIHFIGGQNDVRPYLALMDVGVNCSEQEGLSNAVMEYMASGVACVVSRSGGNPDLIEDGVTGLTFELGDYRKLADGIEQLLRNDDVRERMVQAARTSVTERCSLPVMVEGYVQLYRRCSRADRTHE